MTKGKCITKMQAENLFKEEYKELLQSKDKVAIRTCWNDFTDYLCKDGIISEKQYNTWTHPSFCK